MGSAALGCGVGFAAVKLVEDVWEIGDGYAGPVVCDYELEAGWGAVAFEANGGGFRGVAGGVFEQVAQGAAEDVGV